MTEPQEFSSDFDKWVCSLLDMLRAKGYTNVSVNRGKITYHFIYWEPFVFDKLMKIHGTRNRSEQIPYTQLQTDFLNKQTPQQILDLL